MLLYITKMFVLQIFLQYFSCLPVFLLTAKVISGFHISYKA